MTRILPLALLAAVLAAPSAHAQFEPAELDALFDTPPQVEVNLRGSLLRLAAEGIRAEEPEAAATLDGLRSITVRIYPTGSDGDGIPRAFVSRMDALAQQFERDGWLTMVRVRALPDSDEDGDVWVYVRDEGDIFGGLAVMAMDNDEGSAVFVHIDGSIHPADVARLTSRFGRVDLDDLDIDEVDIDYDTAD